MNLLIAARPPFSLTSVVNSHGWIQLAPFLGDDPGPGFSYIDRLSSGRVIEFQVKEAPGGVEVTTASALTPAETEELSARAVWMLGLEQDLSPFYQMARAEPKLAQMETRAQGRVLRSSTLFEDVVKTILTTNTQWGGTKRMNSTLIDLYGEPLAENPARHAFPTPRALAALDVETLRTQGRLGYRAPYVLELARSVDSGALDLEALKTTPLPTPELRKRLLSIKGVGGYAAANLTMLLGRYDEIPVDSWAMKMVSQEWHGGGPASPADVQAAFAHWGEWKGLAYWFWNWDNPG
ncbi:MAG TPA: hypothetical protein VF813_11370 [Anaerolineaceae bacterium]